MQYSPELDHLFARSPEGRIVRKAVDSPYLHRIQLRHFLLYNLTPFAGTLLALGLLAYRPIGAVEIGLFLLMWLVTGLGVTVGFHRLFTHRSFKPHPTISTALAIMGSMGGLGSVISWVAMHRRHHECADKPGDMHSPNMHGSDIKGRVRGFIHAHLTWMIKHEYPNVNYYTPDLLRDRTMIWISRHYQAWVLLGLAIPTVLGGLILQSWYGALMGFLWGGAVRMFMVTNAMWALNSFLHTIGSRPYKVKDHSGNSTVLSVLAWGEGWHHNHHAFPQSAWFGLAWYRFDPGYWLIKSLEALGLATDVKVPSQEMIASKLAQPAAQGGMS
jgi:stearoyl-CoA desaturase (Delta-9 desaturase)